MRRFLPFLVILVVGCGGAASSAPAAEPTAASSAPSGPTGSAATAAPGGPSGPASEAPSASAAGALPAECAEGLGAYLVAIEPLVSGFDPGSAKLGDLQTSGEAVRSKSMELLKANDSRAPYSCSEVGLEWAYFDSDTPWDGVLAVAASKAPGTVGYLTAVQGEAALDVTPVSAYDVKDCDEAVASIKKRVAAQMSKRVSGIEKMTFKDGLALLGLYKAYMRDVQNEVCPRDALGNDEFDFMSRAS